MEVVARAVDGRASSPSLPLCSREAFLGHTSGSKGLLPESGKAETGWLNWSRVCEVLVGEGRGHGQVSSGGSD